MRQAQRLLAVELLRPRRREHLIRQERIDKRHPRRRGGIQPRHLYGRRAQREHGERRAALAMPAEVNQDIDLIRTDALRLLLLCPLREHGSMNARRLPRRRCFRAVGERIGIDIVSFRQMHCQCAVERRMVKLRRKEADAQSRMMNGGTRRQRLLALIERRTHRKLWLQLLRCQLRRRMAEIEIAGEMFPLKAQALVLGRRLEIRGNRPLRIGERTAAHPHHLREAPLLLCGDLLMRTHVENRLNRLVDVPRMNILTQGTVVLNPAHTSLRSNLKYAVSGGQPIRRGNQLPLPVCT